MMLKISILNKIIQEDSKRINKKNKSLSSMFFQPKLSINQDKNVYEQEADAMADKVMQSSKSLPETKFFSPSSIQSIQRKCAHCEEEEKLHRKETNTAGMSADPSTENYLITLNGKGRPLTQNEKSFFEPRFGYDFANVQLHTNSEANQSAQSINALAYTHGNNIVFGANQYQPDTNAGKKLLTHELTHVVQQNQNRNITKIQRAPQDQTDENDADLTADQVDLQIQEDELIQEFPNIEKIDGHEFVFLLAQFFLGYNLELTRRQQIGALPFPYDSYRKDSDVEMNRLITKLKDAIRASDFEKINEIFSCCDSRLQLFENENDLYEIVASFSLGEFIQLLFSGLFKFLENLEKAFDELQVILDKLKEELQKADKGVRNSWIDAGISLLIDSTEFFIEVSNPWIAAGVELGKLAAKQVSHHYLAPEMSKTFEIAETATEGMDTAKGTAEAFAKKYGKEELESITKKIGKGTLAVGALMDADKIKNAYDERDKIAETIFQIQEKFKGIAQLFIRMGGEKGITRMKFQLLSSIERIKKVRDSTGKLESDLREGFKAFDASCKGKK